MKERASCLWSRRERRYKHNKLFRFSWTFILTNRYSAHLKYLKNKISYKIVFLFLVEEIHGFNL